MAKKVSSKWKVVCLIIVGVLAMILTFGLIAGFVRDAGDDRKQVAGAGYHWEIGSLDAAGKETDGDTSCVRTKNYYSADDLDINLEKDATITYVVYFFDEDKNFLAVSAEQTDDFDMSEAPETDVEIEYFKIVVTPKADAEVSALEIQGYIEQLEATVNKAA